MHAMVGVLVAVNGHAVRGRACVPPSPAIAFALGGISYWLLGSFDTSPWAFAHLRKVHFPDVGRDFQSLPLDLYWHLRHQIYHRQSQLSLQGEARFSLPCAARKHREERLEAGTWVRGYRNH